MAINHKKYYNASAGKNIGRDSLGKEGKQPCDIPKCADDFRKIIEASADPQGLVDTILPFARQLLDEQLQEASCASQVEVTRRFS